MRLGKKITTLLLLISLTFIVNAQPTNGMDRRVSLGFDDLEKLILLSEMRMMLTSVQQILNGISTGNKALIVKSAEQSGVYLLGVLNKVNGHSYRDKTPVMFEKVGAASRMMFEELSIEAAAMDVNNIEDVKKISGLTSKVMRNCLVCHAMYRY